MLAFMAGDLLATRLKRTPACPTGLSIILHKMDERDMPEVLGIDQVGSMFNVCSGYYSTDMWKEVWSQAKSGSRLVLS